MNIEALKEGVALIEKGLAKFSGGPLDYYLKCLTKAYDLLLSKYAPFKVGDRVALVKPPDFDKSPGWRANFWLVPGAQGIVHSSECDSDGHLRFMVAFDDESFKDKSGVVYPVNQKHLFCFFEDELTLVSKETIGNYILKSL